MRLSNAVFTYLVVVLCCHFCKAQDDDADLFVPKAEILAQLGHIKDDRTRQITAVQLYVCPSTQLCTTNLTLRVEENHMEASKNCCSPCSCTTDCIETNSCCVDFLETINASARQDNYEDKIPLYKCTYPMYMPRDFFGQSGKKWMISACPKQETGDETANKWLCESDYRDLWLQGQYTDGIPVTDTLKMISYKNVFCAFCHGLQRDDVTFWTASIESDIPYVRPKDKIEDIVNLVEVYKYDLNIYFIPPTIVPYETYTCHLNTCNETGLWEKYDPFIQDGCSSYNSVYQKQYKNTFCAMCNDFPVSKDFCDVNPIEGFYDPFSYIGILDFNVLDPPGLVEQKVQQCSKGFILDKITMECREVSCPVLMQLVDNQCQLVYKMVKGLDFVLHVTYINRDIKLPFTKENVDALYRNFTDDMFEHVEDMLDNLNVHLFDVNFKFKILFQSDFGEKGFEEYDYLQTNIIGIDSSIVFKKYYMANDTLIDLKQFLGISQQIYDLKNYGPYLAVHNTELIMQNTKELLSNDDYAILNDRFQSLLNQFKQEIGPISRGYLFDFYHYDVVNESVFNPETTTNFEQSDNDYVFINYNHSNNTGPNSTYTIIETIDFGYIPYGLNIDNTISIPTNPLCTYLMLDRTEFDVWDTEVIIKTVNLTLQQNQVTLCPDIQNLCICLDVYEEAVRKYLITNPLQRQPSVVIIEFTTETITSMSFSSISIFSNILTLLVYLLLKQLRSTPGLITMTLTFHLTMFQVIYVISNSVNLTRFPNVCISAGILLHFSFLSYVFWMNVCTFHMYQTFTKMGIKFFNQSRFQPRKLFIKYSVYVYILTLTFVALNVIISMATSNWTDLGYGLLTCYINTSLMTGLSSGLPLGLVLLSNSYLFVRTMHFVARGANLPIARSGGIDDRAYLTAFIKLSILTGVTWVLGLIHQWTNVKVIGFVYIVLNAGQGVLIFVAFVCNKHVISMIKAFFSKE